MNAQLSIRSEIVERFRLNRPVAADPDRALANALYSMIYLLGGDEAIVDGWTFCRVHHESDAELSATIHHRARATSLHTVNATRNRPAPRS